MGLCFGTLIETKRRGGVVSPLREDIIEDEGEGKVLMRTREMSPNVEEF